jgi:hypothetical protein
MTDDDRPIQPDEETPADPPAAVQWMMEQAAAGQSAQSGPVPNWGMSLAPASGSAAARLSARERRVRDALLGNARLTGDLPGEAAQTLLDLGLDMARLVVQDTAGLEDGAAEEILQPRVRAVRRLLMAASRATAPAEEPEDTSEWMEQAAIALGEHFNPPDALAAAAFGGGWQALQGRPAEQIAALRRFIEDHLCREV